MARAGQGDALDRVWAVVSAAPRDPDARACQALAAALGGLLVVGAHTTADGPDRTRVVVPPAAPDGVRLAAAIRALPSSARAVAWCADLPPPPPRVADLVAALDGVDAVVTAAAVTDAVKQVRGDRILRGVPRDGLCRPAPPIVISAGAVAGMLGRLDDGHDPIGALAACGATVRTVTGDAA